MDVPDTIMRKDKEKMVDLNDTNMGELGFLNPDFNILYGMESFSRDDSPCGSTIEGLQKDLTPPLQKKMNWKRRARLGQSSKPVQSLTIGDSIPGKRKVREENPCDGRRSKSDGAVDMDVGEDLNDLAAVAKRPCLGL